MSFKSCEFQPNDVYGADAVPHVFRQNSNVFGTFVRDKNGNIVVFEAITNGNTIDHIDSYWLDIEPSYRAATRARGQKHDRVELNMFDRRGYGFSEKRIAPDQIMVTMNQLPKAPITVVKKAKGVDAYVKLNVDGTDRMCKLKYIHVHDTTTLGIPTVSHIDVHAKYQKRTIVQRMTKG